MTKVSLLIKSHLNDAMVEMTSNGWNPPQVKERLKFINWMVHMFPNTDVKVDADTVYEQFKLKEKDKTKLNEDSPLEAKLIKKGTKFKNNFNGKILTVTKDFEVTLPIDKKSGRKFAMIYNPEFESGYNPSGIERHTIGSLFRGGFTQID
jgi:hypothetical protein